MVSPNEEVLALRAELERAWAEITQLFEEHKIAVRLLTEAQAERDPLVAGRAEERDAANALLREVFVHFQNFNCEEIPEDLHNRIGEHLGD